MENTLERAYSIPASLCDSSSRLGIPDTFSLLMDLATDHAAILGFGLDVLGPQGFFWLAVRTRVRFYRRPAMLEPVTLTTWPERPTRLKANRDYLITRDGETLIAGKTEWTLLDRNTGRLRPTAEVFPPELAFREEVVWQEPFSRMRDEALEEYGRYRVRSTDIDLGGHMNNAAYLRALAGTYSCREWQGMGIRELEISYRSPCYEGNELIWQRRVEGDTISFRAALADGTGVALARAVTGTEGR